MNDVKQRVVRALRKMGALTAAEKVHFLFVSEKQRRKNVLFRKANVGFNTPPEALAYDAYSFVDWDLYKRSGIDTAEYLSEFASRHLPKHDSLRVLEWGCGPARVIRHISDVFKGKTEVYGSDYNEDTIKWCSESIPGVSFNLNGLKPPLPFDSGFFDFVYSLSVFTHLSESVSHAWIQELIRITHSGSILVITTQGDGYLEKMLPDEVEAYRLRGVVLRGNVTEGSRIFSAFHSREYLTKHLFQDLEVVEFIPGQNLAQDKWILRKP